MLVGFWVEDEKVNELAGYSGHRYFKCTCCGCTFRESMYDNYCRNCGARMTYNEKEDRKSEKK